MSLTFTPEYDEDQHFIDIIIGYKLNNSEISIENLYDKKFNLPIGIKFYEDSKGIFIGIKLADIYHNEPFMNINTFNGLKTKIKIIDEFIQNQEFIKALIHGECKIHILY